MNIQGVQADRCDVTAILEHQRAAYQTGNVDMAQVSTEKTYIDSVGKMTRGWALPFDACQEWNIWRVL